MTRVLLTGATGFIGSHVARGLIRAGHDVIALVRPESDPRRIADLLPQLALCPGDLAQHAPLRDVQPEACIHLAWYAEPGKYLHSEQNVVHLCQSLAFIQELLQAGCKRVLCAGTCFEYNTAVGVLSEESAVHPRTLYAACKLALLEVLQQWIPRHDASFIWMRFFYLYGPQEDERRLVPLVIRHLLQGQPVLTTPGEQLRDYLHVQDAAAAVVTALESDAAGVLNIGSGQPVTIRQVLTQLGELLGRPDLLQIGGRPYDPADPMVVYADNSKLRELGWRPRFGLGEGLADTVEWWRERTS